MHCAITTLIWQCFCILSWQNRSATWEPSGEEDIRPAERSLGETRSPKTRRFLSCRLQWSLRNPDCSTPARCHTST